MKRVWNSWGASMIGPLHLKLRLPNQDSWTSRHYSWGEVVVVSDGLGSRSKSDVGSQAACHSVIEAAKFYHSCPDAKIEDVLRLIHSLWLVKISPFEPHECCATCLFVMRVNGKCLLAQLGDGMIAVCSSSSVGPILLNDFKQESFSNLTFSLGREFRPEQWQTRTILSDHCEAVVLCTDGISDDLMPDKQSEFAKELYISYRNYSSRQRINELRGWLKNWPVPGHSDDKTSHAYSRKRGLWIMNNLNEKFVDEYFNVHEKSKLLGQGGQGVVFRTKDSDIAIKLVTDGNGDPVTDQALIQRYSKRLKNVRLLPLPDNLNLAAPVALLKDHVGYVMQLLSEMVPFSSFWLDGKTAKEISTDDIPAWLGQMPEENAKKFVHYLNTGGLRRRLVAIYKCAAILVRLHGNGFVYGDISPANVYVSKDLFSTEVWLIDADNLRFEVESGGSAVYTPKYGAPEIVQGIEGGSSRTDCHAFAVMAFYLLTMTHPFIGKMVEGGEDGDWADEDFEEENLEEKAYAGLLPWVDDLDDDSNQTSNGLPRQLVLTEKLMELFQETFGMGRTQFWKRPSIYHWPQALAQAADKTILCPKCKMSWFFETEGQQCLYCGSQKPVILLFQAYQWKGKESPLHSPCWTIAKELPKPDETISLPERLFTPFSVTGSDNTVLKLVLDNSKVLITKSEECNLDILVAIQNENEGKFKGFISQMKLPPSAFKTGFWLYVAGCGSRLIKCSALGDC